MEAFLKIIYRMHRITAQEIWDKVDNGELTNTQALHICGPRPKLIPQDISNS